MHFRRHFISGLVTIIPLTFTVWLLQFLFRLMSQLGQPLADWVVARLHPARSLQQLLQEHAWVGDLLAIVLLVMLIYLVGLLVGHFVGRQLVMAFEHLMQRIPVIKNVYGSARKLIAVLGEKPDNVQRVVLIDFPHRDMKTVGLVTRTMVDANTGEELAAVYVPTTPNPTSGYLEIVPLRLLTPTDWTMDQAMQFIISGGAVAPPVITFYPTPQ